jgi:hypothetical protein
LADVLDAEIEKVASTFAGLEPCKRLVPPERKSVDPTCTDPTCTSKVMFTQLALTCATEATLFFMMSWTLSSFTNSVEFTMRSVMDPVIHTGTGLVDVEVVVVVVVSVDVLVLVVIPVVTVVVVVDVIASSGSLTFSSVTSMGMPKLEDKLP